MEYSTDFIKEDVRRFTGQIDICTGCSNRIYGKKCWYWREGKDGCFHKD